MKLQLLGSPEIRLSNHLTPAFKTAKAEGLFYYLATTQSTHSRATLATLFWGDMAESKARVNLSKALSELREQVGDYVTIATQTVTFNATLPYQLDVETFLATPTTGKVEESLEKLQAQLDLYRGDFLDGFYVRNAPEFEQWQLVERERLRTAAAQRFSTLATCYQQSGDLANAVSTLRRLLVLEPWREEIHHQLMNLLAHNGEPHAALRQYELCRLALADELDVEPGEEITRLYAKLRANGRAAGTRESPAALPVAQTPAKVSQEPAKPLDHWPQLATPFVGRQAEWQTLQARWRLALRGQPQFVLLAGEAGIGKTRLAEELLNWAHHHGFCTVRSRCYAAEGRLAYAPVIEWLRSDTLRPHRSKVAATWLTELARLLPELLTEQSSLPRPELITPTWQRHQLFEAATRALLALDQPLILLIDDLQWCDKETLELLHFLLRNAAILHQPKVLLVGTARLPDEVEATHPLHELLNALRSNNTLTQLDLARLSEAETSQLAHQMAERPLDNQMLHQLFRDTEGNPLFVVETMRATQGQLAFNGGVDKAPAAILPLEASEIMTQYLPPKVLAVIQARLRQLSPTARELCEWATIVGRAFTLELLTSASKIAADKAVNALDELWQRRIIREQGTTAYDFSHDRIRDVAAAGISRVRRRYLHRCVAETLEHESRGRLDPIAAQIAAHYDVAGAVEKAIDFYQIAAEHAPQIFANYETVAHLERIITLLRTLPESKERDERELIFLITLGPPLAAVVSFSTERLNKVYERAYTLSQQLGKPLPPSLLRILAVHKGSRHDFTHARIIGQELCELARQQDGSIDKIVYLEGCYVFGVTAFWQGHFTEARFNLQQVVDGYPLMQQEHHLTQYGQDTGIVSRTRLGWTLWYLGYPNQARQQCKASLESAERLGHPFTYSLVLGYSASCACTCRDIVFAEKLVRQKNRVALTSSLAKRLNTFHEDWLTLISHGSIGDVVQRWYEYALWESEENPKIISIPHHVALVAEAYQQLGNYQQGLAILTDAFAILAGSQDYWHIAEMYRVKGELLGRQARQLAEAETCFQQALDISRRQKAKSLELRAAMSLAQLWAQQGKRQNAYALLAEVYNWFTEGFDTVDLQNAKALLARLA